MLDMRTGFLVVLGIVSLAMAALNVGRGLGSRSRGS